MVLQESSITQSIRFISKEETEAGWIEIRPGQHIKFKVILSSIAFTGTLQLMKSTSGSMLIQSHQLENRV